jgi:hypothetical protein
MATLSEEYQKRLEIWRKNTIEVKSAELIRGPRQTSYVARKGYGDELDKEDQACQSQ